jgi:hypothetical protein
MGFLSCAYFGMTSGNKNHHLQIYIYSSGLSILALQADEEDSFPADPYDSDATWIAN